MLAASVASVVASMLVIATPAGAVQDVAGAGVFITVACATPTTCIAGGLDPTFSFAVTSPINGSTGVPTNGQVVNQINQMGFIASVKCPSATTCLGVGGNSPGTIGQTVSLNPTTGAVASSQSVQNIANTQYLASLGCPTTTTCLVVGNNTLGAGVVVPIDPATGMIVSGQGVQTLTGVSYLNDVSCPSATECLAVGTNVLNEAISVPLDPTTGALASGKSVQILSGMGSVETIACPTTSTCLAVGGNTAFTSGQTVSLDPATGVILSGEAVRTIALIGGLNDVVCPSTTNCLSVGANARNSTAGQTVALDPATGLVASNQSPQTISGTSDIYGVACQTSAQCLGSGVGPTFATGTVTLLDPTTGAVPIVPAAYSPLTPNRICDTRPGNPSSLNSGKDTQCNGLGNSGSAIAPATSLTINVTDPSFGVPADATSVVLNVTVVNPAGQGFLAAYPAGSTIPTASNINYLGGAVVPNLVQVGVGSSGDVSFYSSNRTDVVVDLEGYTSPSQVNGGAGSGLYNAVASPDRICDTRAGNPSNLNSQIENQCNGPSNAGMTLPAGGVQPVEVATAANDAIPSTAEAAVLNVTVVNPAAQGHLTVYPEDAARPAQTSNVNYLAGQTITNRVIVPLSSTGPSIGYINVYSSANADVIVDVSGYYSGSSGVSSGVKFSAEPAPVRICDTRAPSAGSPANQCSNLPIVAGTPNDPLTLQARGLGGVPSDAVAVVVNLTAVTPSQQTFLTVFPGPTQPGSSDLNPAGGQTRAIWSSLRSIRSLGRSRSTTTAGVPMSSSMSRGGTHSPADRGPPASPRGRLRYERMFVLGIDPGLSRCGYGLVGRDGHDSTLKARAAGSSTNSKAPLPERLMILHGELQALVVNRAPSGSG